MYKQNYPNKAYVITLRLGQIAFMQKFEHKWDIKH